MSSSKTRYEIVADALVRGGRGMELRTLAEGMLNSMLRNWASEYKYPNLRKIGTPITLSAGSQFASLPADLGAGTDSMLVAGASGQKTPIYEDQATEFFLKYSLQATDGARGRPMRYMTDEQGERFIFNCLADETYTITPIYFYLPADLASGNTDADNSKVWFRDDETVIQGLIHKIYQYTGDVREREQFMLVESMKGNYRRGSVPPGGGVSKVMLSPKTFKTRRW